MRCHRLNLFYQLQNFNYSSSFSFCLAPFFKRKWLFYFKINEQSLFFFKLQCTHFIQKQTHKFTWFPWKKKHESFGCAGQNSYINDTLLIFNSRCLHMSTLSVEMFPTSQAQHWESSVNETHMHWKNECWTWWLISVFPVFLRKVSKVRWVNTKQQAQLG